MAHVVDGFELTFTSRTSWKAERRDKGLVVDVVPVTWTKGWRSDPETGGKFLEVWFQDPVELQERNDDREPFVVALAIARDYLRHPHEFSEFRGIFRVIPTGIILSHNSIECRVIERVRA